MIGQRPETKKSPCLLWGAGRVNGLTAKSLGAAVQKSFSLINWGPLLRPFKTNFHCSAYSLFIERIWLRIDNMYI